MQKLLFSLPVIYLLLTVVKSVGETSKTPKWFILDMIGNYLLIAVRRKAILWRENVQKLQET